MYSVDQNISEITKKYALHKSLFDLQDNPIITILEPKALRADHLECSVKISGATIFPNRYNLWFHTSVTQAMSQIKVFLDDQEKKEDIVFNYDRIDSFIAKLNVNLSIIVVFGNDLRENPNNSRIKIWFIYPGDDRLFSELLCDYPQELKCVLSDKQLLFGFDLCFDGSSKLKTYPVMPSTLRYEKNIRVLEKYFGACTGRLIRNSNRIHVSNNGVANNYTIHFQPRDMTVFNEVIQNNRYHEIMQSVTPRLISLNVAEVETANIQNINVYY